MVFFFNILKKNPTIYDIGLTYNNLPLCVQGTDIDVWARSLRVIDFPSTHKIYPYNFVKSFARNGTGFHQQLHYPKMNFQIELYLNDSLLLQHD